MLMENFMNGFPGRECQIRGALLNVLGKDKCEFFFDKFLEYFFTDKDAQFLASIGFNCLRLSLNYHHFEDDMNPFVIKEEGFKHVDRVIDIVSRRCLLMHGLHRMLMAVIHSVQGIIFIPSSTCMPFLGARTKIGTRTILPGMLHSGITSISKTELSVSGSTLQSATRGTLGLRDIIQ